MKKNWLARLEANAVARGLRAMAGRWFRSRPVVADAAFQDADEPYPGHWREFPQAWPGATIDQLRDALDQLPHTWRAVLLRHDSRGSTADATRDDRAVAAETGLTVAQERDILTRARAAVRDALDRAQLPPP
jgi:RNA polymerase sigma-70 factor (ECF subfamily)